MYFCMYIITNKMTVKTDKNYQEFNFIGLQYNYNNIIIMPIV